MFTVVAVAFAFPLGAVIRDRLAAFVSYLALYLYAFTLQTDYLTRAWVQGDDSQFTRLGNGGPGYLAVTTAVLVIGCGLVVLGHRTGARRRDRNGAADLDSVR